MRFRLFQTIHVNQLDLNTSLTDLRDVECRGPLLFEYVEAKPTCGIISRRCRHRRRRNSAISRSSGS